MVRRALLAAKEEAFVVSFPPKRLTEHRGFG